jgi:N-acetylglucosamine kinase-like BadF-type ATPase
MSRVTIGADVGGTKTAVAVALDGKEVARSEGPGAAVRPGRALVSAAVIAEVVRRALATAGKLRGAVLVIGASGAGRPEEREELRAALRTEDLADSVRVTSDIEIALAAAFGAGPGIVVTAGTGSVAVARDPFGRIHRTGGYGWQMGDEGSGYAVGRSALGAVGRAADGRSPKTGLSRLLLDATRSETMDQLIRWAAKASPAEVASLAPAVLESAGTGDTVAQGIVDYAARELAQLVLLQLEHFGADERSQVPVATNGGLLRSESSLRRMLLQRLHDEARLKLLEAPVDPPKGALLLADEPAAPVNPS